MLSNENTSPLFDDLRKLVSNIMDSDERKILAAMVPLSEIFAFAIDIDLPKEKK